MSRLLTVNVVLFSLREDTLQVLLAAPAGTPILPAEPPGAGESLEGAANRLIAALIDRRETYLEQLYTYGEAGETLRVVYFALVPAGARLGDGAKARWVPAAGQAGLTAGESEVLVYALRRLRYKLEYSAVGFQLLPGEFTLSELQHTYEIILGETLDKRNFRRRMLHSGIIEETPRLRVGDGRPARLYRYRPDAVAEVKARRLFP
ncbi:MAG: NUDIX hydrolase [Chloroflexi bacterium]|nr:NUDIX hydrolase [Chloroflexota bacterium]